MAYTDQSTVEDYLKRSLTDEEAGLFSIITGTVDNYIDSEIGGSFGSVSESTKYYDGGSKILETDPFKSLTNVQLVDSTEAIEHTYVLNEDFEARPRNDTIKKWIEKRVGKFPGGVANIAVTAEFTLGDSIPDDIKLLATYLIAQSYSESIQGDLSSESIEGYSRTFKSIYKNNDYVNSILDQYREDETLI